MKLHRSIRVRGRYAAWGAVFAMHVMFVVVMASIFVPAKTSAQGAAPASDASCYARSECENDLAAGAGAKRDADFEEGDSNGTLNGCKKPQGKCYARSTPIALAVSIGNRSVVLDIGDYIATTYRYAVGIAAIIAAIMMMIGGFQYLTAGGDAGRVSAGKQRIIDALVGLGLTLGAFTLLNTINPDLVSLRLPKVALIKRQTFVGCKATELCFPCGSKYGVIMNPQKPVPPVQGDCKFDQKTATLLGGTAKTDGTANVTIDLAAENVMATCVGRGCFALSEQCSNSAFNCAAEQSPAEPANNKCGEIGVGTNEKLKDIKAGERYLCQPCKVDGAKCTGTGQNAECCSKFCADAFGFDDICTAGAAGDTCDNNNECASGICQTNWGNSCSTGEVGSPCGDDAAECRPSSGAQGFCSTEGDNRCTTGGVYSMCDGDSECSQGMHCHRVTGDTDICLPSGLTDKKECGDGRSPSEKDDAHGPQGKNDGCSDPLYGIIGQGYCIREGFCTNGLPGSPCTNDIDCAPVGTRTTGICVSGMCQTGGVGSRCGAGGSGDCVDSYCYKAGDFSTCVSGKLGSRCDHSDDCKGAENLTCQTGNAGQEKYRGVSIPIVGRCLEKPGTGGTPAPAP